MSHLDEGELHSLLDGELDESARQAAEAHLATCAECRREYEEAKALLAGADELIAAVELPPITRSEPVTARPRTQRGSPRFTWRSVAWAASLVLAAGLGWLVRPYRSAPARSESHAEPRLDSVMRPAEAPAASGETAALGDKEELKGERGTKADRAASGALAQTTRPRAEESKPAPGAAPVTPPAPMAAARQAPQQEEVRALTDHAPAAVDASSLIAPTGAPAERDRVSTSVTAGDANATASTGLVGKMAITREVERSGFNAPAARKDGAAGVFQPTAMEAAVRMLGGSIRLVDGLTPIRVMVGPGTALSGADSGREVIRVVYMDPPGRELWLDQQRPEERANERVAAGRAATTLLAGDTLVTSASDGARSLAWINQNGFRLALTGFLPADSLRALARRVQ
jgi:hypothetical protein